MENNENLNNVDFVNNKKNFSFVDKINNFLSRFQYLKIKDKVIFYRLLSTMINSGMWVLKSVQVLEKQEKNIVFKNILWRICEELREWKNLSECLSLYPNSFSREEIWIIKSWEKMGKINDSLLNLANSMEKVASISWKIKSAMMYPFFILLIVWLVIIVMMTMLVPKLLEIFEDKDSLPWSTKALIFMSDFISNYWIIIILFFIIIYMFFSIWKKTPAWLYIFDGLILKIPVFWEINNKFILSKFSRIFSNLISSWVSVVESLSISSDAVWNDAYRQRILLLREDVKNWIKIWESLESDKLFPEIMVRMIQVWERTGKLDKTIVKVADFYDEQVNNTISVINKLLEPIIIVFLSVVVWFIAISIMQPIMNLADTISNS